MHLDLVVLHIAARNEHSRKFFADGSPHPCWGLQLDH